MAKKPLPPQEYLNKRFAYDPGTGVLRWRSHGEFSRSWNSRWVGTVAGYPGYQDRLKVDLDGVQYFAHRLIWKMMTGVDPDTIDHQNGVGDDNRWPNLRNTTAAGNSQNTKLRITNTSGHRGVYRLRNQNKWTAAIGGPASGGCVHLGTFGSIDEAIAARVKAEIARGYHPNHGRR